MFIDLIEWTNLGLLHVTVLSETFTYHRGVLHDEPVE
jgi:hypothetical protein